MEIFIYTVVDKPCPSNYIIDYDPASASTTGPTPRKGRLFFWLKQPQMPLDFERTLPRDYLAFSTSSDWIFSKEIATRSKEFEANVLLNHGSNSFRAHH